MSGPEMAPQWLVLAGLNLVACLLFVVAELAGVLRTRRPAEARKANDEPAPMADGGAPAGEATTEAWLHAWAESGGRLPAAAGSCRRSGGAGRGGWLA